MQKLILLTVIFCYTEIVNAQPGKLDPPFGTNGVVIADLGADYNYPFSNAERAAKHVLLLPDRKMYILFTVTQYDGLIGSSIDYSYISKRLQDGSLDSGYGNHGVAGPLQILGQYAAITADGKIVIAGLGRINEYAMVRYNERGKLDSSFGNNKDGKQPIDFYLTELAIQSDGKILLAGQSDAGNLIARYNIDGSNDNTFGNVGKQPIEYFLSSVAIQNDGKIVIAHAKPGNNDNYSDFAVTRYNSNGSLDKTFNKNGTQITDFGSGNNDYPFSVIIQKDGKIVAAGSTATGINSSFAVARYNEDGSPDKTFSDDGKQATAIGDDSRATAIAIQSDGKIVTAGITFNLSNNEIAIVRYNADGSLDSSFSVNGKQTTTTGFYIDDVLSAGIHDDEKIILLSGGVVVRYNKDGSLDDSFQENGILTKIFHFTQGYTRYTSAAKQSDGKIVAAGTTWNGNNYDFALARYNTDGSLDKSFSEDGIQTTDFQPNDNITSIAIQTDGKIVAAGSAIARYNANGSLDNTFSEDGHQTFPFYIRSIAIQSDGKIVVAGAKSTPIDEQPGEVLNSVLARYNIDGSLDKSFSEDGIQTTDFHRYRSDLINSIAIQKNGKIVVAGSKEERDGRGDLLSDSAQVLRYDTDGSPDKSFASGIKMIHEAMALGIQNDGKIIVAVNKRDPTPKDFAVARLNNDGTRDSTFADNGATPFSGGIANALAIQNDGKIVIGGYTTDDTFFGVNFALFRYNNNGSADNSFSADGRQATDVSHGSDVITGMSISNNKLYTIGYGQFPGNLGIVASYLLDDEPKTPTVNLTIPSNIIKYAAPARIKLNAAVTNIDGAITKVRFYSGTTFLHTETIFPYGFLWDNVSAGTYTLTAIAFDNDGNQTTSNSIEVSVVDENVPPVVSIVNPADDTTYTGPATINLIARAKDPNDRISKVEFYNGATLLTTEYIYPYTYTWNNVQPGTYTITAKATDDKGLSTTSDPVTVTVTAPVEPLLSSSLVSVSSKINLSGALSVKLSPNPAGNYLQIFTNGLQKNKPSTISVLSASGVVIKTMQTLPNQVMQMDISSLRSGIYFLKVLNGDKVLYTQFIKL